MMPKTANHTIPKHSPESYCNPSSFERSYREKMFSVCFEDCEKCVPNVYLWEDDSPLCRVAPGESEKMPKTDKLCETNLCSKSVDVVWFSIFGYLAKCFCGISNADGKLYFLVVVKSSQMSANFADELLRKTEW